MCAFFMTHTFHQSLSPPDNQQPPSNMYSVYIAVFLMALVSIRGDCNDVADDRPEGCYDDPNIGKIVCLGIDPCVCMGGESGEETYCTKFLPVNLTAADMNGQKCRDICEASNQSEEISPKCEYFRWEEVVS